MTSPYGELFEYTVRFGFKASNNEAECEASLANISQSIATAARRIVMITDPQVAEGGHGRSLRCEGFIDASRQVGDL